MLIFATPIPIRKKDARRYRTLPIVPIRFFLLISKRPVLNIIMTAPVIGSPELKMTDSNPLAPKSLNALFAQLNQGARLMDNATKPNPIGGVKMPNNPANRSILLFMTRLKQDRDSRFTHYIL